MPALVAGIHVLKIAQKGFARDVDVAIDPNNRASIQD